VPADVVATAVYTDGTLVDFRVQLVAPPFAQETTYSIDWCIDGSEIGSGSCSTHADGIDTYLTLYQAPDGAVGEFGSSTPGVDPCLHAAFEEETNTLRVLVPVELVDDDGDFDWVLTVTFGGSGGANEWCPNEGTAPVTVVDELPPFSGTPSCF